MNQADRSYREALGYVLTYGKDREDRTGTGRRWSQTVPDIVVDFSEGFPCSVLRPLGFKNQLRELLWMLSGSTNVMDLPESVMPWWSPFANEMGSLGKSYGYQFRNQDRRGVYYDQLGVLIENIKTGKGSSRLVGSLWDSSEMETTGLPCCHGTAFQFFNDGSTLSLTSYNRSQDMVLGTPHNIMLYSLLLEMICKLTELKAGTYVHKFGDGHIYLDHIPGAYNIFDTEVVSNLPTLKIADRVYTSIDDFKEEDFSLVGYEPSRKHSYSFKMSV